MKKIFSFCLGTIILNLCFKAVCSQENSPVVKNIFKTIKSDTAASLWTFKKTDIFRINVIKMNGESKLHKHPDADHTILVIKGMIHAEIGGNKFVLHKGDMVSIPAGMPHKYRVYRKKAIIVSMDAPYYNPDKTILLE